MDLGRTSRQTDRLLRRLLIAAALWGAPAASGATVNWTNAGTGDWNTASNWSSNPALPGSADIVNISTGTGVTHSTTAADSIVSFTSTKNLTLSAGSLTIAQPSTITANLTLSGGTLAGDGDLTVNGALAWTSGTMSGAGTTIVPSTRTLTLGSAANTSQTLSRAVNNTGTVSGSSYTLAFQGGTFNNLLGGTFNATGTANFNNDSGVNAFNNAGTFTRSTTGTTTIAVPFNNSSTVNITGGTLALTGGGTQTGSFTLSSGTKLVLGGDHTFATGATLSTTLNLDIHDGKSAFNIPLPVASGSTLTLSGGELSGTDDVTINGTLAWTDGIMSGSGTTIVPATKTVTLVSDLYTAQVLSRVLNNSGTISSSSDGVVFKGGTLNNLPGGAFNVTGTSSISNDAGTNAFNNAGTLTRSTTGTTTIAVPFNNSATVNITAGTLSLTGGGTQTGAFALSTGAKLVLGGNHTFAAGSSITGPLMLELSSGTTTFPWATTVATGNTLTLSGGTLSSSFNTTVNGSLSWTGGGMAGTGTTTLAAGSTSTVNTANGPLSLARVLDNYATMSWVGATDNYNPIGFYSGTFNNRSGAVLTATDRTSIYNYTGVNAFNNSGTFNRAGADMTWIDVPFNNSGTVNLQAGLLALYGGGTQTGRFTFNTGARLWLGGDHTFAATSTFTGPAGVEIGYGTTAFAMPIGSQSTRTATIGVDTGGAAQFNSPERLAGLTLAGGTAAIAPGAVNVLVLDSLSISSGGTLDIGDNAMILHYAAGSPAAAVQQWVNNRSIFTSAPTASGAPAALALVDNHLLHLLSWQGETVSNGADFNELLLFYTYTGDVNLDGKVDQTDYYNIIANMGKTGAGWFDGDLNGDGTVSLADFDIVSTQLAAGAGFAPSLAAAFGRSYAVAVPEPASLTLLAVGALALLRRRR